jgi:hypothetical protein
MMKCLIGTTNQLLVSGFAQCPRKAMLRRQSRMANKMSRMATRMGTL